MKYTDLIEALEKSVEKHGEQPLTNKWLLNIMKMVQKRNKKKEEEQAERGVVTENASNIE